MKSSAGFEPACGVMEEELAIMCEPAFCLEECEEEAARCAEDGEFAPFASATCSRGGAGELRDLGVECAIEAGGECRASEHVVEAGVPECGVGVRDRGQRT